MKSCILLIGLLISALWSQAQEKVLICKSGGAYAYHNSMCRGLKECTHTIERVSISEATKLKRKPCGYCYVESDRPAGTKPTDIQCKGITQKGTRCSRNGKYNGYCYQHGS